jgi:hypothetical protein
MKRTRGRETRKTGHWWEGEGGGRGAAQTKSLGLKCFKFLFIHVLY